MDKAIAKGNSARDVWIDTPLVETIRDFTLAGKSFEKSPSKVGGLLIKGNFTDNKANRKSAFYDLRRRGKAVKRGNLSVDDLKIEQYMFGHESTRLDKVYIQKPVSDKIADQKRFHKEIKSPTV